MKKGFSIDAGTIFILILMAAGAFFLYVSLVDFGKLSYKVKIFPMWTSITLIVLCALELLLGYNRRKPEEKAGNTPANKEGLRILLGFCWMLSLALGILIFGFYIALPLFALAFLRVNKVGWLSGIMVAIGVLLVAYLGFGLVLGLRIYPGLLFAGIF